MSAVDDLGRHLSTWAWEGIEFPGDDATTSFGHDSAKHQGYGQRGSNIETTGPKALTVKVRAVLVNGLRGWRGDPLFPEVYQRLTRSLTGTAEGLLTHPTRGLFTAHFDDASEEIRVKERRGLYITLTFTEQNGEADLIEMASPAAADPAAATLTTAAAADAAKPAGARSAPALADEVADAIEFLDGTTRSFVEGTARFSGLLRSIAARLAEPAALAVEAHAYRVSLLASRASTLRYRARYFGGGRRTYVVPAESSLARIASDPAVYGTPRRAADLARANTILDPSRVPAGTVLTVVD